MPSSTSDNGIERAAMIGLTADGPSLLTAEREFAAPLRIGVVSDTHIYPGSRRAIPVEVFDLFRRAGIGLIIHAGDINQTQTLLELRALAPLLAVFGNNDERALQRTLPRTIEFQVGNVRFGLLHGHGGVSARVTARASFRNPLDCVIYGHSHIPMIEREGGVIYFNPGSPTDRRFAKHFGVGLIDVSENGAHPDLVLFDEPGHLVNVDVS
jgi:uncharacterized protein